VLVWTLDRLSSEGVEAILGMPRQFHEAGGGLAVMFGMHRFVAALLLNLWFIIALGLRRGQCHLLAGGLRLGDGQEA
jgi:hypothetical protein